MKRSCLLIFTLAALAAQAQITPTSFSTNASFVAGMMPIGIANADIDGDGKQDVIVTNYYDNSHNTGNAISVYRNQFTAGVLNGSTYAAKVDFTIAGSPQDVVAKDMDGDGKPDLVVANYINPGVISVLRNTATVGAIDASSFASKVDFSTSSNLSTVAVADLDGDGKADVVTGSDLGISIFKNNSSVGSINLGLPSTYFAYGSVIDLAIGDIDGDGKRDIIGANLQSDSISLWRNISTPGNIQFEQLVSITTANRPDAVTIADLDGNGKNDVIVGHRSSNEIYVYRNNTSAPGSFTSSSVLRVFPSIQAGSGVYSVLVKDLDLDGKSELVIGRQNLGISVYKNNSTPGVFTFENEVNYQYPYAGTTGGLIAFDYDNDGRPDLAGTNYDNANGRFSVLRNETAPPAVKPDFTYSVTNLTCGAAGSITLTTTAGTAPFQYSIDSGSTFQPGNVFNGLAAGTYAAIVKNAAGASQLKPITLTQAADTILPVIVCPGDITVTANGCSTAVYYRAPVGTDNCIGAVTKLKRGFASGSVFPVGTTRVEYEVKDAAGNKTSCSFKVIVKSGLTGTVSAITHPGGFNVTCNGKSDGQATALASNGCAPYTYEWNTYPVQTTETAINLSAGNYKVKITDANGNSINLTVKLTQPPVLTVKTNANTTVYYGYAPQACAQLIAKPRGGTPGYTYLWSNGATVDTPRVCPTASTEYTVKVTDANGCTATSAPMSVCVVDVRCGNNGVSVCHKSVVCSSSGKTKNTTTCVPVAEVAAHLAHGDKLGACGTSAACNSAYRGAEALDEETTESAAAVIYPNPFNGSAKLEFRATAAERTTVEIYNTQGVLVAKLFDAITEQGEVYQASIDGTQWAKGLYLVKIVSATEIQHLKLILAE